MKHRAAPGLAALACVGLLGAPACSVAPTAAPEAVAIEAPVPGAAEGEAQVHYLRALALLCGTRSSPDAAAAARWLKPAAERGHHSAQSVLGWLYMTGVGVARDNATAARWLQAAAEAGNTAAQNNLGVLYAIGAGVEHDHVRAKRWFSAAAAKGAAAAQRNLKALAAGADPQTESSATAGSLCPPRRPGRGD